MHSKISLLAAALLLSAATPALADTITVAQAHAVVDEELDLVAKNYVFPEKRAAIVAAIRAKKVAGAYDITNPADLADKLGGDMIAASNDKHMWMQYDPAQYAAIKAPAADPHGAAYFHDLMQRVNYGYKEMRVLPGNVRYLNLTTFNWDTKSSPDAVANAARFLGGGDAVIIDLRENGGGAGEAVRAIVSYFMPEKKQELMAFHDGTTGTTDYSYVDLKLGAPRMMGKPLYVLTSGGTGSAAEEFAYHIKMFKLGTLIGETTAGAANNDFILPIAPGFVASISTGRAIHPVNNSNWEGTGVAPDVAVPVDQALNQAQLLALKKLAAMPGADAKIYAWAMAGEQAHLSPPAKLAEASMRAYAGTFGIRTVALKDGALTFQRDGRPVRAMTMMADDLFTLGTDDQTRIQFRRKDGKVVGFDMLTSEGAVIAVERTS